MDADEITPDPREAVEAAEAADGTPDDNGPDAATPPPAQGPSRAELRNRANDLKIKGRSKMSRDQLVAAIAEAEAAPAPPDGAPASPDHPTDGRPPLVQVAQGADDDVYVRVIGAPEED